MIYPFRKNYIVHCLGVISILILLLIPSIAFTKTLTGKVIGISDGDTITILDSSHKQHKIRLYGIDCPEGGQPFGKAAKKHTARLAAGKQFSVEGYDTDRYGRIVGVVTAEERNVNRSLINNGYAWQYRKYCKASFCGDWLQIEKQVRNDKVGLWCDNDPIPPWEWRKGARNSSYKSSGQSYELAVDGYHGNVKSYKFHSPRCRHYNCKNCTQVFSSRPEAVSAGYQPCGMCKP